ncbi:MAG: hypothetical protein LW824_09550 [Algoriphagus sp.]|nr:hypothetical protein [Algoriphagus sp.]
MSPDLTRNEKSKQGKGGVPFTNEAVGAENYGTLAYVIESSHEAGTIWTGSDDGLVQLTRDGGATWSNVTPKELKECLINAIEVSPHDPATAYIATTRYKFNDYTPALYKTTDYGKTWTNISKGIPYGAFTRVVREDSKLKNLLFAGTEQGIYLSKDGGLTWVSFQLNLPVTPITDLKVAHDDLIVATAGRSYWILDELNAVRELKKSVTQPTLYTPEKALLGSWYSSMNGANLDGFTGTDPFQGQNPASGMVLYYHLPEAFADSTELTLEIHDAQGNLVRKLSSKGKIPTAYIESSFRGHKAIPGTYSLKLSAGNVLVAEAKGKIQDVPGSKLSAADFQAFHQWMSTLEGEVTQMHNLVNTAKKYQDQLQELIGKLDTKVEYKDLKLSAQNLVKELTAWDESMIQRKSTAYDDVENLIMGKAAFQVSTKAPKQGMLNC